MHKPELIVKDVLLIPIFATKSRIVEISNELKTGHSQVLVNSLFLTLVSYMEAMQKEIITYYLKYHPEKIASKKFDVRVEIISTKESFEVLEEIISEYVDSIPTWDRFKMLVNVLGIQKPPDSIYSELYNISATRNKLIHKNLRVSRKHVAISNIIDIELEYFYESIISYDKFIDHIIESISRKYSEYSKVQALKNLWHFMFETNLCANFEDYWYIDEKSDTILGIKKPDIEKSLSHSEKFMLELWRSQVQVGYNLSFPNLSSLTTTTQSKVFMFLKLSNDIFLYSSLKSKA